MTKNFFSKALGARPFQYDAQYALDADLTGFVQQAGPICGNRNLGVAYRITLRCRELPRAKWHLMPHSWHQAKTVLQDLQQRS